MDGQGARGDVGVFRQGEQLPELPVKGRERCRLPEGASLPGGASISIKNTFLEFSERSAEVDHLEP